MEKLLVFLLVMVVACFPMTAMATAEMTPEELMTEQAKLEFQKTGVRDVLPENGGEVNWVLLSATDRKVVAKIVLLNRDGTLARVTQTTEVADKNVTINDVLANVPVVGEAAEVVAEVEGDKPEIITKYETTRKGKVQKVTPKRMRSFMIKVRDKL